MRGQPEIYDELKEIVSISITPTARAGLDRLSEQLNISRSELIERVGRGLLTIAELTIQVESN
jgi:metal-responsive CopG/Arc/MetJ family transcriptional regulator